jgi:hypothetical protein
MNTKWFVEILVFQIENADTDEMEADIVTEEVVRKFDDEASALKYATELYNREKQS